jgi:NADH-quinone oxidoreductase subunit D
MTLNIGPAAPATHGTLRIIVRLDGEQVVWAEPSAGYMHRGYEKLTEVRTFPQVTTLINRIDWLGSFANEVPFILAAEKLMEIEAPPRAQLIRTILFELSRIANVGCSSATSACSSGAITPVFIAFRDREYVLNLIEGADRWPLPPQLRPHRRLEGRPAGRVGRRDQAGHAQDAPVLRHDGRPPHRQRDLPEPHARHRRDPARGRHELRAVGRQRPRQRHRLGPAPRPDAPMAWNKADWKVWTHPDGDSFARCWIRLQEVRESCKIVEQLCDSLPAGPIMAKVPRIIKVPEGEAWVSTENPLGEMGYYVVSKGDTGPFRVKIRSASFNNVSWSVGGSAACTSRRHHDPRVPLLHPGWTSTVRCSSRVDPVLGAVVCACSVGIVAVLIPAGTIVYVSCSR